MRRSLLPVTTKRNAATSSLYFYCSHELSSAVNRNSGSATEQTVKFAKSAVRKKTLLMYALLVAFLYTKNVESSESEVINSFTFEPELRSSTESAHVCARQNSVRHECTLIHISKESTPLASFGGVGQVVGELLHNQDESFTSGAIIPKYGFIEDTVPWLRFEYTQGSTKVWGAVYLTTLDGVLYFLVGPPSHIPTLWQSIRVEDVYAQPKIRLRKVKAYTTDLYFSFVAAHLISHLAELCKHRFVAHVHGGSNAPALWFLRQITSRVSAIYTVHDYNREPLISYPVQSVVSFSQNLSIKRGSVQFCDRFNPRITQPRWLDGSGRLDASHFAWCADMVTAVSDRMIEELANVNENYANLLSTLQERRRLVTIHNWLSSSFWKSAREAVSANNVLKDKSEAKHILFTKFRRFRLNQNQRDVAQHDCVVLWIGRFEVNKGVLLLPALSETACAMSCTFIIYGHWTHINSQRLFERVQATTRKRLALKKDSCDVYVFKDRASQKLSERVVRAASDITVVPSYNEAYGFVAAEALAYGSLPVVSSIGGLPEIVHPFNESLRTTHDLWTGFTFPVYKDSPELTVTSVQSTLHLAIKTITEMNSSLRETTLKRVIYSTPRADTTNLEEGPNAYAKLVHTLVQTYSIID